MSNNVESPEIKKIDENQDEIIERLTIDAFRNLEAYEKREAYAHDGMSKERC